MWKFSGIWRSSCQAPSFFTSEETDSWRGLKSAQGHRETTRAYSGAGMRKWYHVTGALAVIMLEPVLLSFYSYFRVFLSQAKLLYIFWIVPCYLWLRYNAFVKRISLYESHCMNRNCRNHITEIYEVTNCYSLVIYGSDQFSFLCLDDVGIIESLMFFSKNPLRWAI